jgi:hypothetical protein
LPSFSFFVLWLKVSVLLPPSEDFEPLSPLDDEPRMARGVIFFLSLAVLVSFFLSFS